MLNLLNSAVGQDPAINVHISGIKTAQVIEELLNIEKFNLVQPNIRVAEQMETQRMMNAGQGSLDEEQAALGESTELSSGQPEETMV